jgi:hypothetical protein
MAPNPVVELRSLPECHPTVGDVLLREAGAAAVYRLKIDPTPLAEGCTQRDVTLHRQTPSTEGEAVEVAVWVSWGGLTEITGDYLKQVGRAWNEFQITERAAVILTALLIHHVEGLSLETVLPIGSGGDYYARLGKRGRRIQVEISGIRVDEDGGESGRRLRDKCDQVLTVAEEGYASVVTFRRLKAGIVHAYLRFVERPARRRGAKKRRR